MNVNQIDKENSSKEEKLIERINLDNTPFTMVKENGKWFGLMGDYKMTEDLEKMEDVKKLLEKPNWNIIVGLVTAIVHLHTRMNKGEK